MRQRHFATPAREMLLDDPQRCPLYPPLTLDGLAVTDTRQHYLLLSTPTAGFYAGPDTATVTRRAHILATALQRGQARLDPLLAEGVQAWVLLCWDSALDELTDAIAGPTLQELP